MAQPWIVGALVLAIGGCFHERTETLADAAVDGSRADLTGTEKQPPIDVGPPADNFWPQETAPPIDQATTKVDALVTCASTVAAGTVLQYSFSSIMAGAVITDDVGTANGQIKGPGAMLAQLVSGSDGCPALQLPGSAYVQIPDDPAWELPIGGFDLVVRFDQAPAPPMEGIVSRDAKDSADAGHITLVRLCDGRLAVRLQGKHDTGSVRCSSVTVTDNSWHEVKVNWGGTSGLELVVDGTSGVHSATVACMGIVLDCTANSPAATSIAGNNNPWVIGAHNMNSTEGTDDAVAGHLVGAIDRFRISNVNR